MAIGTYTPLYSIGGKTVTNPVSKTADHPNNYEDIPLAAGKGPLTSWVKTDADTAAGNLPAGHGYSTGKMDVYWQVDGVDYCRYDVDGTVAADALTLDGGDGDDFPESANATVVVCTPQQIDTAIDGDKVKMFCFHSTATASLYFEDVDDAAVTQFDLVAKEPTGWHDSNGLANPLTGNPITVCFASNGTVVAGVLNILSLVDATP